MHEYFDVSKALKYRPIEIIGIFEQRKVTRSLKSSQDDDDEDEDEFGQNLNEYVYEAASKKANKKKKKQMDQQRQRRMKPKQRKSRRIFRAIPKELIDQLHVRSVWSQAGVTGANVNVAVLVRTFASLYFLYKKMKNLKLKIKCLFLGHWPGS